MRTMPRLPEKPRNFLAKRRDSGFTVGMIRRGFLDGESRKDLTELARDGLATHRLARRANALVLLVRLPLFHPGQQFQPGHIGHVDVRHRQDDLLSDMPIERLQRRLSRQCEIEDVHPRPHLPAELLAK
jgi:hypothetical protein